MEIRLTKLILVTTRDIPEQPSTGRDRLLRFIAQTLSAAFAVTIVRLSSVLERFTLRRGLGMLASGAKGLLTGRWVPIQSLAFFDRAQLDRVIAEIEDSNQCAVYLDGVRTLQYARRLRQRFGELRIVCDLDDLISRRAEELLRNGLPIRAGYLTPFMPGWLRSAVLNGPLRRGLLHYERAALERAEIELCGICQQVVLLSAQEAEMLRSRLSEELRGRVVTIEPAVAPSLAPGPSREVTRFIFVGSDLLLQNQLSIDYLMGLWESHRPSRPLHIYGHMQRSYLPLDGVHLEGYAAFDEIYTKGSVALCPAFLKGGVKTKVLEALEYGVLPVGNETSFEGIQGEIALSMNNPELVEFIIDPLERLDAAVDAAIALHGDLINRQSAQLISAKWISAFSTREPSGRNAPGPAPPPP